MTLRFRNLNGISQLKMHFIKYLAILAIIAFQFTLQDSSSSSLESSSESGSSEVKPPVPVKQEKSSKAKSILKKLKSKAGDLQKKVNSTIKMHFIKYLAIFAILAFQFTLQEDFSSISLESSSESESNEVQLPVPEEQAAVPQKKTLFSKLKGTAEKLKDKMVCASLVITK
uniref:Uncharacterized protein n=1 Tax=Strongyloides stercoralis TaxID=6248 RepID=A0AAF5DRX1_STRER